MDDTSDKEVPKEELEKEAVSATAERFDMGGALAALKKKKLEGTFGGVDLEATLKRMKAHADFKGADVTGEMDYKKNWQINVHKPMFDGHLHLSASSKDGEHSYTFRFERKF